MFTGEGQDEEGKADEYMEDQKHGNKHAANYIVGWDPEHNNAWKMDIHATFRDFAAEVKAPEGAVPEDPVVATFADGSVLEIPDYTCGDCQASGKAHGDQPKPQELKSPYFHGRLPDGGLVTIKNRKNSGVLFVATVCPEGQVAQCRGDHFGILRATVQKMIPLAEKYVNGNIGRVELKKQLSIMKQAEACTSNAGAEKVAPEGQPSQPSQPENKVKPQNKRQPDEKAKPQNQNKKAKPDESDIPMFDDEDALPMGLDE